MCAIRNGRGRSGELCPQAGWYVFDGFTDLPDEPFPTLSELEVTLAAGDVFPVLAQSKRECYWRRAGDARTDPDDEAGQAESRWMKLA